ncbi:MAG: hydrogenase maturation protease [Acidimicrobiales bacterium]
MTPALVIGVGNPYRRDDGVGIAVIERLREVGVPSLDLVEESGEPVALVQRWSGRDTVVLVDAVESGAPAGTLHRFECVGGEWDVAPPAAAVSTHGIGVAEAVALGDALECLPRHLVLYGIEVGDVGNGVGLSPEVAAALDTLVDDLVEAAR